MHGIVVFSSLHVIFPENVYNRLYTTQGGLLGIARERGSEKAYFLREGMNQNYVIVIEHV